MKKKVFLKCGELFSVWFLICTLKLVSSINQLIMCIVLNLYLSKNSQFYNVRSSSPRRKFLPFVYVNFCVFSVLRHFSYYMTNFLMFLVFFVAIVIREFSNIIISIYFACVCESCLFLNINLISNPLFCCLNYYHYYYYYLFLHIIFLEFPELRGKR